MNIKEEYIRAFVKKRADYYVKKWKKFIEGKGKTSWNWASFFFLHIWFAYRKMYTEAIILVIILSLISSTVTRVSFKLIQNPESVSLLFLLFLLILLNLAVIISVGMFGNYIYYEKFLNVLKEIDNPEIPEEEKIKILEERGGTSIKGAILMAVAGMFINYTVELLVFSL